MWSKLLICFFLQAALQESQFVDGRPNVLFLMADDLRVQLNYNMQAPQQPFKVHPEMHTPNLDKLASESAIFNRAYVQQSVCNPSRTSALTSRRPDTTGIYDAKSAFRDKWDLTTIPQYFKESGYMTLGVGKIFHADVGGVIQSDPISWSEPAFTAPNHPYWKKRKHGAMRAVTREERAEMPLPDEQVRDKAVESLRKVADKAKSGEQNFFLAVGFHKPHLPFIYPREMHQHYPRFSVDMPDNYYAPVDMPKEAWNFADGLFRYDDVAQYDASSSFNASRPLPRAGVLKLRRAYYSCVSFIDELIGDVISELEDLGLADNTIISFWGDHGWQLGEHGAWSKQTNFELANRVPFLIKYPEIMPPTPVHINKTVEMVDLFPTLVEMAIGDQMDQCPSEHTESRYVSTCTEGTSLVPLMSSGGSSPYKMGAISQFPRDKDTIMGYSIKTDQYRYTAWVKRKGSGKPNWNKIKAEELYDHTIDPEENINRVNHGEYKETRTLLRNRLVNGWAYIPLE